MPTHRFRDEIRDIQKTIGIAAIYVTHDQEEALATSDQHLRDECGSYRADGTPEEIYADPQSIFVASFVGTMNVLPREAAHHLSIDLPDGHRAVTLAVRPEHIRLDQGPPNSDRVRLAGSSRSTPSRARGAPAGAHAGGQARRATRRPSPDASVAPGSSVPLTCALSDVLMFDGRGRAFRPGG